MSSRQPIPHHHVYGCSCQGDSVQTVSRRSSQGNTSPDAAMNVLNSAPMLLWYLHSTTQEAGGSKHSNSIQLYSLNLKYIYIFYFPSRSKHRIHQLVQRFIHRRVHREHESSQPSAVYVAIHGASTALRVTVGSWTVRYNKYDSRGMMLSKKRQVYTVDDKYSVQVTGDEYNSE
jgi:hypothetical protein